MPHIGDRFSFSDLASCGKRIALRLRIGPPSGHRDLTFTELRHCAAHHATMLEEAGCDCGDRIALLMPPSEELITTFFGALYSGLIPAIIAWPTAKMDTDKYRRNVTAVVASLKADWLVTDTAAASGLGEALGSTKVICATTPVVSVSNVPPCCKTTSPAFIQFSGGTTGTQKSVPISYETLACQLDTYGGVLQITDADHVISWLPLYHDMGLVACLLLPFVCRIPVTIFSPIEWVMDPTTWLEEIGRCRATLCWLPNFAFPFMASRVRETADLDLSSLRAVINCSEPVRAESMDAFAARFSPHGLRPSAIHTCYAMAETTFAVTQTTDADPPRRLQFGAKTRVSCGRPIPGMDVSIDTGGEIRLRGTSLMDNYLDQADRRAFTDGWYRTGDLGTVVDGHLYVTGRQKDVIIVGGINIYPEDVEAAVGQIKGIHPGRVVSMGIEDETRGTEKLVVVAEVNHADDLRRRPALETDVRVAVVNCCGIAPHRVVIVPPHWIIKSTAGKIARAETRTKVEANWNTL